jgi:hypothetical protein
MKKRLLIFMLIGLICSCNTNDDSTEPSTADLIGVWKLIENLADPGDGSGVFVSVDSEKTIAFNGDGSVNSNGSLCDMSPQSDTSSNGTYSLTESIINSEICPSGEGIFDISFVLENASLIISYPCIEPCQSKYIKIE